MATRKYKQKQRRTRSRKSRRSRRSRSRSRSRKLQKGGDIGQVSPPMNATYPVKSSLDGIGEVKN